MEHNQRKRQKQPDDGILWIASQAAAELETNFMPYKWEADSLVTNIIHQTFSYQIAWLLQFLFLLFGIDMHIIITLMYTVIGLLLIITCISYYTGKKYNDFRDSCTYYYLWIGGIIWISRFLVSRLDGSSSSSSSVIY